MSLADLLAEATLDTRRQPCSISLLRSQLPPEDAEVLTKAMDDPVITSAAIARALGNYGHKLAPQTVQRHRRGDCTCRSKTS